MEGSSTHLRCSVYIDLCALERNMGRLRSFLPKSKKYIALLSADAFGYGAEAAAVRLMLSGADAFAVTNAAEGARVREIGAGWQIIILSSSIPGEEECYFENLLTPVISNPEEAERFENCARRRGENMRVHLRLPILGDCVPSTGDAKTMLEKVLSSKHLIPEAFCLPGTGSGAPNEGSVPDPEFLEYARKKFSPCEKKPYIHHSDVCDAASMPECFEKSLRAGLVLFGVQPSQGSILKGFKPEHALTFRSSISQIKRLPKGATVGYSRKYTLEKDSKVALISAGYGDGLAREAGSKASVIIRGRRAPVIGIVSMDQASVDVSEFDEIEVGDEAVIIGSMGGEFISIEEYCRNLSITPAQALTSITKRVARFYKTLY